MKARNLALLLLLAACGGGNGAALDPLPTAATLEPIRGAMNTVREERTDAARQGSRVEIGSRVETGADGRGAMRHDGGAWVLFDRDSALSVEQERLIAERGRIFVDARRGEVVIRVGDGEVRASDATFAVDMRSAPSIYCGSGEITWVGDAASGEPTGYLAQGETLVFDGTPEAEATALWDDWTGGLADPAPWHEPVASFIGVLEGRMIAEKGVARRHLRHIKECWQQVPLANLRI